MTPKEISFGLETIYDVCSKLMADENATIEDYQMAIIEINGWVAQIKEEF